MPSVDINYELTKIKNKRIEKYDATVEDGRWYTGDNNRKELVKDFEDES